jgi:hypothetical protein
MHKVHPRTAPYAAPALTRFGTFRELTRVGFSGLSDGFVLGDDDGSTATGCDVGAEGLAPICSR